MIDEALMKSSILESAKEAFETMIFLPLEEIDEQDDPQDQTDSLLCSITFTGQLRGCLILQCSKQTAEKITKSMMMIEGDDPIEEAETCDAIGEVVNLVIGGIKSRISEVVSDLEISIPSVIKGQKIRPALGREAIRMTVNAKAGDNPMKFMLAYAAS